MEQSATQVIEGTASTSTDIIGPGLRIEQVTGTEEQSPGMSIVHESIIQL